MQEITYTLVLEVRNKPGVLVRIAHVFARRGCNIQSLHVQPHRSTPSNLEEWSRGDKEETWSTMTIAVKNVAHIDQIVQQLQKLVDVARVDVHNAAREV